MPRISDETRARRRTHILTSAWRCFALNGFQATSMDDVIAATGMSSSAVYRYFRSKDEIIDATTDEGLTRVRDDFARMATEHPVPSPTKALASVIGRLRKLAADPADDMTRIAMQTWAEALRRPALHDRARALHNQALDHLTALAARWLDNGHLAPGANPRDTAATFFTVMQGVIVYHHLVEDLSLDELLHGLSALGRAVAPESADAGTSPNKPLAAKG
jgi:AcrR family transcriptional regulator